VQKARLSVALDEFIGFQQARRLAPKTIESRVITIRQFVACVGDLYCGNVTGRHIDAYLGSSPWSPRTLNARLSHLRQFFDFCRGRRLMRRDHDPLLGWRPTRVPERDRLRVPLEEWPRLFAAVDSPWQHISLAVGLYLFLRSGELQSVRLRHIHLGDSELEVYRAKNKTWDVMPISAELDAHLRRHLTWLASVGVSDPDHFLLPNRLAQWDQDPVTKRFLSGTQPLDPCSPYRRPHREIQVVLRRAGYPVELGEGMHTLRRSGARAYFDSLLARGYDGALRRVQSMLGHASSQMTEVYLGLSLDRQTRNRDLAGQVMFPALAEVTELRAAR
jgi:integrase